MSGIAGIYHLDGQHVDPKKIAQMLSAILHRGPNGCGIWHAGIIGFGHRLLWTTPESLHERLPLADSSGKIVITADARIDNRQELISMLGLTYRSTLEITDSQLILAAYEKWDEHCPKKIIGDFAFAIWDDYKQALFCARDHFGIRPFYYYKNDHLFVFSSEIKALLALPEVPKKLDELAIGCHLAINVEDKEITFYRDIRRLLPGHSLTLSPAGISFSAFWSLDPSRELHLSSDEEYAEAFREIFFEAVRCRLGSAFPIGSLLSGGLDSSSVTCVARELLQQNDQPTLHTISGIYDKTSQCDERPYIDAVLSQGHVKPHYLFVDHSSPFADLDRILKIMDQPFPSPQLYISWGLCQTAQAQGIRILLDGLDGDTAVHHGDSYLAELARAGNWTTFAAETKTIARHENLPSVPQLIQQYGLPYLTELAREGRWLSFIKEAGGFAKQFGIGRYRVYRHCALEPRILQPMRRIKQQWFRSSSQLNPLTNSIIRPEFARRIYLDDRLQALEERRSQPSRTARDEHYTLLTSGLIPYAFEMMDKISITHGIESRHPFADRRLIEFCLALPPTQKLHHGWIRMIVRRALSDILPEKITWRGGKTSNSPAITRAITEVDKLIIDQLIMHDPGILEPYVDITALHKIYERYLSRKNLRDEMLIWQTTTLAMWLRSAGLNG